MSLTNHKLDKIKLGKVISTLKGAVVSGEHRESLWLPLSAYTVLKALVVVALIFFSNKIL